MTDIAADPTKGARLRLVLRANAAFSALCGAALALASTPIAELMGVGVPVLLLLLGIGLLGFAATMVWRTMRPEINPIEAWVVVVLDGGWVVASALILLLAPDWFSVTGQWIVAIVAVIVADFALFEYLGIRRARTD